MSDPNHTGEELILRDHLALDRTRLANERTLLSYLRTSVMLLVAGGTAVKFVDRSRDVVTIGWVFIGLSIVIAIIGVWRFLVTRCKINRLRLPGAG